MSVRRYDGADAGVGGANDCQPFFNGSQSGGDQVLIGSLRDAVPAVVGQINQPLGAVGGIDNLRGKYYFIADESTEGRLFFRFYDLGAGSGQKIGHNIGYGSYPVRQPAAERNIFAERNQMRLVVKIDN